MSHFTCPHCNTPCYDSPRGYVTGCVHYPAEIQSMTQKRCSTKEMRRIILDMYEVHPPITIAELTGRSVGYIRCVASAMGIKSGGRGKNFDDNWTPAEEKILDSCFGRTMTVSQLAAHLGRTEAAIAAKASRLGLGRRRFVAWTKEDDATLREHYTSQGAEFVATKLGRTREAVKHRARKLGVRREPKQSVFSQFERQRFAETKNRRDATSAAK